MKIKPMHVYLLVDESGSMAENRSATISAINEYMDSLAAKQQDGEIFITLRTFSSDRIRDVHSHVRIKRAERLDQSTYDPGGTTPLYDALGTLIEEADRGKNKNGTRILFVVMTDGLENASRSFTRDKVFQMIENRQRHGCPECGHGAWTFVFLGANQDSWAEGAKIGYFRGNVCDYVPSNIVCTMKGLAEDTFKLYESNMYFCSSFCNDVSNIK